MPLLLRSSNSAPATCVRLRVTVFCNVACLMRYAVCLAISEGHRVVSELNDWGMPRTVQKILQKVLAAILLLEEGNIDGEGIEEATKHTPCIKLRRSGKDLQCAEVETVGGRPVEV